MNSIEIKDLKRVNRATTGVICRTTKEIVAVDDISFDIKEGELFGLLGPGGAGKRPLSKFWRPCSFQMQAQYASKIWISSKVQTKFAMRSVLSLVSQILPLTRGIASARTLIAVETLQKLPHYYTVKSESASSSAGSDIFFSIGLMAKRKEQAH